MARRMLDAFERNRAIPQTSDHLVQRDAVVCAALLHDVGHGPFSHVFEEVSEALGKPFEHEEYTREIIAKTKIADILAQRSLLDPVLAFFQQEPSTTAYSTIISGQLDADRLDFLVRDRYFTGVRYGIIDLEWLFDSLVISEVQYGFEPEDKGYFICVDKKGISVIEDFVNAYVELYENVYLHKTTRGIQILFEEALKEAFVNPDVFSKLPKQNALVAYFSASPPTLEQYLKLDESIVLELIHHIAQSSYGLSSEFASRFLSRKILKCVEISVSTSEPNHNKVANLIARLKEREIWFKRDIPTTKGYKHFEVATQNYVKNIFVKFGSADFKALGSVSPNIIKNSTMKIRFYFKSDEDRELARAILSAS